MPKTVPINVYMIGCTQPRTEEIERWLSDLAPDQFKDQMEDFLDRLSEDRDEGNIDESEVVPGLAAKRCYNSFIPGMNPNVTKVREQWDEYFANILHSRHGAVLEHTTFNFAIEGVSRVFTAEMNRHRAGWAISEGSMRFIRFDQEIQYWLPTSIQGKELPLLTRGMINDVNYHPLPPDQIKPYIDDRPDDQKLDLRKQLTREIFNDVFEYAEFRYKQLLAIWEMDENDKDFKYKKQVTSCLRRIVPIGVSTGGVWTGNIRALRHVLTLRCAPEAEEEIQLVFSTVAKMMSEKLPNTFGDFTQDEAGYWRPKHWKV